MFVIPPPPPPAIQPLGAVPPPPPMSAPIPQFASLPVAACDTECYRNYWLIKFSPDVDPANMIEFESFPGQPLDVGGVVEVLKRYTIVTFNGLPYDMPMITLALSGADNATLKAANDMIIVGKLKPWEFYRQFNLQEPTWIDHIDLKEMSPGVGVSLKTYGGRLNSHKLQDLPIDPSADITPEQRPPMRLYCGNDLYTTLDLFHRVRERLELRAALGAEYGLDLRSKSDAQIAEAVIKSQLGFQPQKAFWQHGTQFQYEVPEFIRYTTPTMQTTLQMVRDAVFVLTDKDQCEEIIDSTTGEKIKTGVIMPPELKNAKISIGSSVYRMGIGGLHSSESSIYHVAQPGICTLTDADVTSYYPSIILQLGLFPSQLGPRFLEIFRSIVEARVYAKNQAKACFDEANKMDAADKKSELQAVFDNDARFFDSQDVTRRLRAEGKVWQTKADGLKITINGTFGKTGSKWSIMFSPNLMIQTTITGQLSLLMLIEALEQCGIPVVSANTDGIVIKCPFGMEWLRDATIKDWEQRTGFNMEYASYSALFSRDVNNYVALKPNKNGKIEAKTKGVYADAGLTKNPANMICIDAVVNYLTTGKHPAETIRECTDVRRFLTIRLVKTGAVKGDKYLGKTVRFYYGVGEMGAIHYSTNGNRVARSEGGVPMMELSDTIPSDIDYNWYIREAYAMLSELGIK